MKVSDRIALMQAGDVLQYDTPEEMFYHPTSKPVADYMGQSNYIVGVVKNGLFESEEVTFETDKEDGEYELMVRPSAINLTRDSECKYKIKEVLFEGETAEIILQKSETTLLVWMLHQEFAKLQVKENDEIGIVVDFKKGTLFQR